MRNLSVIVMAAAMALSACCNNKTEVKQEENKMIRLNVSVSTDAENLDTVIYRLNRLAAASREEEGCEGYEIYQSTVDPTQLMIVETWEDQDALDAHAKTPHYDIELSFIKDKIQMKLERFEY